MESTLPFLLALGLAMALGFVVLREHRALRRSRSSLLDRCEDRLQSGRIESGLAEFPRLTGRYTGRPVHAELIPDTMTIRRLPQLWLSVTLLETLPVRGGFAVLVRPSGNDYYSLTETFPHTLQPPGTFPWEVLVRGASLADQRLIDQCGALVAGILSDPKVKEVAVTPKGVRIVWQAAEGRRGEHLLLRQAIFDNADVTPDAFDHILSTLLSLSKLAAAAESAVRAA